MYSLLKTYKNTENHRVKSHIIMHERMAQKHVIWFNCYPYINKNLESEINANTQYFPIKQQNFLIKKFWVENLVEDPKHILQNFTKKRAKFQEDPVFLTLFFQNSNLNLDLDFLPKFSNNLFLTYQLKILTKLFSRLDSELKAKEFAEKRVYFFNTAVKNRIQNLNFGYSKMHNFLKNFVRLHLILFLLKLSKKKVKPKLPLFFCDLNKGGLLFKIPGLYENLFTPFGFLQARKKFSLEFLQTQLQKKFSSFFLLQIHSIKKTSNKFSIIARFTKKTKKKKKFKKFYKGV